MLHKLDHMKDIVQRSFGVDRLSPQGRFPIHGAEGQILGYAASKYLWFATIRGAWIPQTVAVGSMYCPMYLGNPNVLLGVLLISKDISPNTADRESFLGEHPFRCVEMHPERQEVIHALQLMNLVEEWTAPIPDDLYRPSLNLQIHVGNGMRSLEYDGGGEMADPSWIRLRNALAKTMKVLIPLYNDRALDEKYEKFTRWRESAAAAWLKEIE